MDTANNVFTIFFNPSFENFLKSYTLTISLFAVLGTLLAAFGTWAAVIVSLWLGLKVDKPRLTAFASVRRIIPSSPGTHKLEDYLLNLTLSITNHGSQIVYFQYFGCAYWHVPFSGHNSLCKPITDFRDKELELLPGKSISIILDDKPEELFLKHVTPEILNIKFLKTIRFKNIGLYINTSSGQTAKVRFDKSVEKLIPNFNIWHFIYKAVTFSATETH